MATIVFSGVDVFLASGWILESWQGSYDSHISVILAPDPPTADTLRDLCDGTELIAFGMAEYLASMGSWVPFANGFSLAEALTELNHKLSSLALGDQWKLDSVLAAAMRDASVRLAELSNGDEGIRRAMADGRVPADPLAAHR